MATNLTPSEDFTLEVRTVLSTTGSVSSVSVSGGSTGLVFTGNPVTTSGTITMSSGQLVVANGGTGTGTAFTQGSVVFAGAAGVYSQDNANFFWDNTNERLGLGTAAPRGVFHAFAGAAATNIANLTTTDWSAGAAGSGLILGVGAQTGATYGNIQVLQTGGSATGPLAINALGGNVGIGTTSPQSRLVVSNAGATGFEIAPGANALGLTDVSYLTSYSRSGVAYKDVLFDTNGTAAGAVVIKAGTGNVGIGTTAPSDLLHVSKTGAGANASVLIEGGSTTAYSRLTLKTSAREWRLFNYPATASGFASDIITLYDATAAQFRLNVDANGKVGIGTTGPAAPLDIVATTSTTGFTDPGERLAPSNAAVSNVTHKFSPYLAQYGSIWNGAAAVTKAVFQQLQGISGTNTAYLLNFSSSDASNVLVLRGDNGNVGVGTTAPAQKLSVVGTVEITAGSGGVLKFADGTTQSTAAAGGGAVGGSAAAGQATFWSATSTVAGDNAFSWDNTNKRLGIGISTPGTSLHVLGTGTPGANYGVSAVQYPFAKTDTTARNVAVWASNDAAGSLFKLLMTAKGHASAAASRLFDFQTGTESVANDGIIAFQSQGGMVAIGSQAPGALLDIKDNASTCLRLSGSTSGYVGLRPAATAGSTTYTLPSADGSANYVLKTNGAGTLSWTANGTPIGVYDVTTYGAVADAKVVQDGAMDNNVTFNLTCASAPFVVGDVGKAISVSGAGAAGTLAYGTITGFTSTSVVAVSFKNTSGVAISGKTVSWGTDNTTAFTNALAAANTSPAFGSVVVPPGTYRISTHFTIPVGVRLSGNGVGPKWAAYGSVLHQVEGYGSAAGTAFISAGFNSTVEGLAIYSPHQVTSGTPVAYPFTIKGSAYSTIQNIFLYNAYQGVDVASEVNNPYNGAFTIRGLYGEPLALGIDVNKSFDVAEISNVHFWPFWSLNEATMAAWKRDNAIGIRFGRSDYQLMHDVYIGNMGIGVQLNHNSSVSIGGTSGTWTNIQLDSCHIGIDAYETGYNGLLISNLYCSGVNLSGTHYGIKSNPDATYYVILAVNNAQFWSNLSYGMYIDNQNGLHNFSQMQFHQASNTHAYINRGATSITNSWFLPSGGGGLNVTVSCTENVMFTCNQTFTTSVTISNATTLSANNQ